MDEALVTAAGRAGHAMRRLATAASGQLGADCFMHAAIGRELLADLGFDARLEVGEAAWRVGEGDGDVIAHTPRVQGYLSSSAVAGKVGLAYHAWLVVEEHIVDFTTYQFERKGRELDAVDGGHTTVDWRPDVLVLPEGDICSYQQVAESLHAGVAFYQAHSELLSIVAAKYQTSPDDLNAARLLMANPQMMAFGPNDGRIQG